MDYLCCCLAEQRRLERLKENARHMKGILSHSYVRRGGKISERGTVFLFSNEVPDCDEERAGLEVWSQAIFDHRHGNFHVKCERRKIAIYDENDKLVLTIPTSEIFVGRDESFKI